MSEQDEPEKVSGLAVVKKPKGHGSHRITPPKEVRDAVGMVADEPWSWYWLSESGVFLIRRSGAHLEGIPDSATSVGVAESRRNGRYLDFAIPVQAVEAAGLEKGQQWRFTKVTENTMRVAPAEE